MASFADITIRFGADLNQFSSQMQIVERRLFRVGRRLTDIGSSLTLGVTAPLVGLGGLALDAAADFETLEARLETALGSNNAAKETFKELSEFTKDLTISTEEAAESYIRLKNLGLDPTIEALTSYGNTAAAQGKSVNQLIEAVADAATGEFERLKEFGIRASREGENVTFTFQGLSTTIGNNAQEIQGYLQELGNTTFAGALEAQANTFNGIVAILRDNIRSTLAEFGQLELEAFKPLLENVNSLFDSIRALSPETKRFLVIFGGIAAAVGPLLALAGTILPAIGTGFALLTGPIGLIVAGLTAIGAIIIRNWEPIQGILIDIANYFIDLYNEAIVFRVAVEAIRTSFNNIYDTGVFVFRVLGQVINILAENIKTTFVNLGDLIKALLTGNFEEIPDILRRNFDQATESIAKLVVESQKEFSKLKETLGENIAEGIDRAINGRAKFLEKNVDTTELTDATSDATEKGIVDGGKKGIKSLGEARDLFKGLGTAFVDEVASAFSGRTLNSEEIANLGLDGFTTQTENSLSELEQFEERSSEILERTAENFLVGFGDIVGAIASGSVGLGSIGAFLLNTMGEIAQQLGKAAIQIGVTMDALKKAFTVPFLAIGAGTALVALGALLKNVAGSFAGNFTNGGFVGGSSFTGDRLLAGVNSGELILNIAQQKNLAAAIQANNKPVILAPSLEYSLRGLRVKLNEIDNLNSRIS